ncbi:MAG TPA: type II toxin-antitoxin system mRNA interferase toxin, RelE/StbE family [Candidatus Saccharimonadales bacterium]|nr:type II toxin-antitoxin system mRNA interferase toxin, RelE/StbE family [Candidatus Saccharimonadales bacterium]
MRVDYSKTFLKQYSRLSSKLQTQTDQRIKLWQINPNDPKLYDHPLKGKYKGYRSINITGDIRALYCKDGNTIIIFGFIGTHSQLYG